jgi:hypothetical protein
MMASIFFMVCLLESGLFRLRPVALIGSQYLSDNADGVPNGRPHERPVFLLFRNAGCRAVEAHDGLRNTALSHVNAIFTGIRPLSRQWSAAAGHGTGRRCKTTD